VIRRVLLVTGVLVALLSVVAVGQAQADDDRKPPPEDEWSSEGMDGTGIEEALRTCLDLYDTRPREIPPGSGNNVEFAAYWLPMQFEEGVEDFPIPNLAGCATTLRRAGGHLPVPPEALSRLAINAQCQMLENDPEQPITYPYEFYGNPLYRAANREDCVFFLRQFHLGNLPPGPPGGGQS
jgi:hypothetical protein